MRGDRVPCRSCHKSQKKVQPLPLTGRQKTNALVVEAGSVGLILVSDLARRDITCRMFDQQATSHQGLRAHELVTLFDRVTRKE